MIHLAGCQISDQIVQLGRSEFHGMSGHRD